MFFNEFNDFDAIFDKAFYNFNRDIKDQYPYKIKKYDDRIVIVHNILGVSAKDIKIDVTKDNRSEYLVISGSTKNETLDTTFSINTRFEINANDIENIEYMADNGLLYVTIYTKKPIKPNINIKRIEKN